VGVGVVVAVMQIVTIAAWNNFIVEPKYNFAHFLLYAQFLQK
jgi:Tfp pilus assembly protein PilE